MSLLQTGIVFRSTGSWYEIKMPDGNFIRCKLKGKFKIKGLRTTNPLAVGDLVDVQILPDKETGLVVHIHDRENYIIRKATNLSKATHMIAANIHQAVLIASLEKPRTSTGFIDRFLVTAEAYHIPAVIVFNKYDLYDAALKEKLKKLIEVYEQQAGYVCLVTSAKNGFHVDDFKDILKDKVSLLSGHSGVGKSALINKIDTKLNLKEGEISHVHLKGKHTTTFSEMYSLSFGGYIIDTPGIKEFGLVGFDKTELGQRFPEIRRYMPACRFNDCLHVNEPDCAVIKAVEDGEIAGFRYRNYLNMLADIKN